jgi:hypothetical protein
VQTDRDGASSLSAVVTVVILVLAIQDMAVRARKPVDVDAPRGLSRKYRRFG